VGLSWLLWFHLVSLVVLLFFSSSLTIGFLHVWIGHMVSFALLLILRAGGNFSTAEIAGPEVLDPLVESTESRATADKTESGIGRFASEGRL
jgi:hypothetical protein